MKHVALLKFAAVVSLLTACVSGKVGVPIPHENSARQPAPEVRTVKTPELEAAQIPSFTDAEALHRAAMNTYNSYRKNASQHSNFIPYDCWDEGIKKLNPIYIYMHQYNVVVVQTREYHEYGLYFTSLISSYALQVDSKPDKDGFTFQYCKPEGKNRGWVYTFKRDIQHQVLQTGGVDSKIKPPQSVSSDVPNATDSSMLKDDPDKPRVTEDAIIRKKFAEFRMQEESHVNSHTIEETVESLISEPIHFGSLSAESDLDPKRYFSLMESEPHVKRLLNIANNGTKAEQSNLLLIIVEMCKQNTIINYAEKFILAGRQK